MTFPKALKLLLKGKCKSIKNESIQSNAYQQTLETIGYWFCEDKGLEHRKKIYEQWMFSKDWKIDETN